MNEGSLAPCGVLCDLCLAYQREKNICVGCNREGPKPNHCTACGIKLCPEKGGDARLSCAACGKFPCRRIRDLSKRYVQKYGEDLVENLRESRELGLARFVEKEEAAWKCASCGALLCVHRADCLRCGARNPYFPENLVRRDE